MTSKEQLALLAGLFVIIAALINSGEFSQPQLSPKVDKDDYFCPTDLFLNEFTVSLANSGAHKGSFRIVVSSPHFLFKDKNGEYKSTIEKNYSVVNQNVINYKFELREVDTTITASNIDVNAYCLGSILGYPISCGQLPKCCKYKRRVDSLGYSQWSREDEINGNCVG